LFGIFVKDASKSSVIASSIVAIVVHFSVYYLGLTPYTTGEVRNPAVASAIAIVASLMTGIIFLMVDRKKEIKYMKRNAKIIASGWYAPEQIVSNQYFNELLGEDVDTWLKDKVQIYNRRWCSPDESSADLAEEAIRQAIENVGLLPEQIDLLIIATDTPEFISPSTASVVQDRLGLKNRQTFDLNTACAGFVTALDVGASIFKRMININMLLLREYML
jgi:hypothetical protein